MLSGIWLEFQNELVCWLTGNVFGNSCPTVYLWQMNLYSLLLVIE